MRRKYTYKITLEEDNDEFWENQDLKVADVTNAIKEALASHGFTNVAILPKQIIYEFEDYYDDTDTDV
jgi:hypothetical protein